MTRHELTENYRRLRQAEARDPVENAVYALAALSAADRTKAITRSNAIYQAVPYVPKLIEEPKA